jgi:hypothetical protein
MRAAPPPDRFSKVFINFFNPKPDPPGGYTRRVSDSGRPRKLGVQGKSERASESEIACVWVCGWMCGGVCVGGGG